MEQQCIELIVRSSVVLTSSSVSGTVFVLSLGFSLHYIYGHGPVNRIVAIHPLLPLINYVDFADRLIHKCRSMPTSLAQSIPSNLRNTCFLVALLDRWFSKDRGQIFVHTRNPSTE